MAQQRLYTEKQVRRAIAMGYDWCHVKHIPSDDMIDSFIESLNPIKIPTDEEICLQIEKTIEGEFIGYPSSFRKGAKWMRDQILNK